MWKRGRGERDVRAGEEIGGMRGSYWIVENVAPRGPLGPDAVV